MSELGDLIVERGPFHDALEIPADDLNALRDELIELREIAAIAMPAEDGGDR